MKNLIGGTAAALALMLVAGTAAASKEVCERQKDAAPSLVDARDGEVKIEDVKSEIEKAASSPESAKVLNGSVDLIYADKGIDISKAMKLVYERCIDALGE